MNSSGQVESSEHMLSAVYGTIYGLCQNNDVISSTVGSYVIMTMTFWGLNAFYLLVDITGRPKFISQYKVQQDKNFAQDKDKLIRALKTAAFNNLVLNAMAAYPIYLSQKAAGVSFAVDELPNISTFLRDIAISVIVQEIVFYYSHRLCHHPLAYQRIHRKHHEWTAPIGIVAIYSTPVEYLTGNGLSVFLGPLICSSHIMTWWFWYILANFITITDHSGYHFPGFPSPQFHDYHHKTFNWNYGTLGILDWLHGTDKQFRPSVQRQRHRTFFSTKPIHILYPDDKQHSK